MALSELYGLPADLSDYFQFQRALYTGICHFGLNDLENARQSLSPLVDSAGESQLDSLFLDYEEYRRKYDPDRLEMMSIILPGLGQTYGGKPGSGINSLLLLTAISTYSYYTTITYSLLDGLLFFTSWFYRYYTGGHRKAHEIGVELLDSKKEEVYTSLLNLVLPPPSYP